MMDAIFGEAASSVTEIGVDSLVAFHEKRVTMRRRKRAVSWTVQTVKGSVGTSTLKQ